MDFSGADKIFAIGDIHGCADELQTLLEKLPLTSNSHVVFLGDYIDRGENSRGVLDIILNFRNYYKVAALLGNHEAMFLDFLNDPHSAEAASFIYNGGSATLASYATHQGKYIVPTEHLEFLSSMPLFTQSKDAFFVHAGVPDIDLNRIVPVLHKETLLWVREEFFNSKFKWNKIIVHGHTPVEKVEIHPHRINVDTGCVFEKSLSAIELPGKIVHSVKKLSPTEHKFLRDESGRIAVRFEGQVPVDLLIDGQKHNMETVNYSEFGLLLKNKAAGEIQLKMGDSVEGEIKAWAEAPLKFNGRIVRVETVDGQKRYAIQILRRPTT